MGLFKKRAIAYIADFFVVSAIMWILAYICYFFVNYYNMFQVYQYFIFLMPVLGIIYFTVMEKQIGATVGKRLMFIEVKSTRANKYGRYYDDRRISYKQAFIRSISKIYWMPIILDIILGKISGGDRILNKISRTEVVYEDEENYY